jgi:hypothetical protein
MVGAPRRICIVLDSARVFRWHLWLAEALEAAACGEVTVELAPHTQPLPSSLNVLFELECLVYGLSGDRAVDSARDRIEPFLRLTKTGAGPFDVVIDLAVGESPLPPTLRILTPHFDGVTGEIGAIAGLTEQRVPAILVDDSSRPATPWTARPASLDKDIFGLSLDNILSSTVCLLTKAASSSTPHGSEVLASREVRVGRTYQLLAGMALLRAGAAVTHKAIHRLRGMVTGGRTWVVGWRAAQSRDLLINGAGVFNPLRDDGRRYYADPFPFRWQGRTFLFMEEFAYATGRGCIAVSEIGADGHASPPRPVLEEPYHLSYPFVFEQDGQIWMIPESGAACGVYLYRAVKFPSQWKREACLIAGSELYDATLSYHGGMRWMFACARDWKSSSWDVLKLFSSDHLSGGWEPHGLNPAVIDGSTSRPAGIPFVWRGEQLRPAQNCTDGYGRSISLCRIDKLDRNAFQQSVIGKIHAGPYGCHTYNFEYIEVIDAFARRGLDSIRAFYESEYAAIS